MLYGLRPYRNEGSFVVHLDETVHHRKESQGSGLIEAVTSPTYSWQEQSEGELFKFCPHTPCFPSPQKRPARGRYRRSARYDKIYNHYILHFTFIVHAKTLILYKNAIALNVAQNSLYWCFIIHRIDWCFCIYMHVIYQMNPIS